MQNSFPFIHYPDTSQESAGNEGYEDFSSSSLLARVT